MKTLLIDEHIERGNLATFRNDSGGLIICNVSRAISSLSWFAQFYEQVSSKAGKKIHLN
jgi:hypothetical protein